MNKAIFRILRDSIRERGVAQTAHRAVRRLLQHGRWSVPALWQVAVEVTTHCNLGCPGCLRTVKCAEQSWDSLHMALSDYRKIVQDLPKAQTFASGGIGEPTLHPQLPELIRIAASTGKFRAVCFTSNGMARPPEYYDELFEAGLTRVDISVDTLDQELADHLRKGTSTKKLRACLQYLAGRHPGRVGARTVIRSENVDEIPNLLSQLNDLGPLNVSLQYFIDMGNPDGVVSLPERKALVQRLPAIASRYPNLRIKAPELIEPSPQVCIYPWWGPAVTVDGYVMVCCNMMDKDRFNLGNALETPFDEVWNARSTREFRREFALRSPDFCVECPYYEMRR
jgi:MoaA/NifB/PqqE/SkfB family radical SAM enzyme